MNAAKLGFVYTGEVISPEGVILASGVDTNIIPQVGIDYLASLIRGTGSVIGAWYVGVGEGNYVPTSATTSADLQTSVQESLTYSQTSRPIWTNTYDGVSVISSFATRAEYTFTEAKRLYTGFLVSNSIKGTASGTLLSIARFASPYDVPAGSTFRLGVAVTLLPSL